MSHIKEFIAWRTSVGGGGGGQVPQLKGARQRAGLTLAFASNTLHASGRRFTHNSSAQSKNPLTAITVSTATACSAASKCHRLVASKPERFKEVRPGNDDGVLKFWRNWRGYDDVMQTRSIRGSGEPVWVIALLKCARTIGTRSAQSIMASGFTAAQTGRTHDRTRPMPHKRQKVLAKAAPSTHDPKATFKAAN